MKTVAEVIGVSRSNLIERMRERAKKRIGRPPLPDDNLVAEIKAVIAELWRGRLKVAKPGKPGAEIVRSSAASTHETHTHELRREGGQMGAAPGAHRLRTCVLLRACARRLYDARVGAALKRSLHGGGQST
jgi:hypothetical protein